MRPRDGTSLLGLRPGQATGSGAAWPCPSEIACHQATFGAAPRRACGRAPPWLSSCPGEWRCVPIEFGMTGLDQEPHVRLPPSRSTCSLAGVTRECMDRLLFASENGAGVRKSLICIRPHRRSGQESNWPWDSVCPLGRTADLSWGGFDRLVVTPTRTFTPVLTSLPSRCLERRICWVDRGSACGAACSRERRAGRRPVWHRRGAAPPRHRRPGLPVAARKQDQAVQGLGLGAIGERVMGCSSRPRAQLERQLGLGIAQVRDVLREGRPTSECWRRPSALPRASRSATKLGTASLRARPARMMRGSWPTAPGCVGLSIGSRQFTRDWAAGNECNS